MSSVADDSEVMMVKDESIHSVAVMEEKKHQLESSNEEAESKHQKKTEKDETDAKIDVFSKDIMTNLGEFATACRDATDGPLVTARKFICYVLLSHLESFSGVVDNAVEMLYRHDTQKFRKAKAIIDSMPFDYEDKQFDAGSLKEFIETAEKYTDEHKDQKEIVNQIRDCLNMLKAFMGFLLMNENQRKQFMEEAAIPPPA